MSLAFDEIQLTEVPAGTIVRLIFKDTLKKEDYEHFVPMVEKIMESRGKIRRKFYSSLKDSKAIRSSSLSSVWWWSCGLHGSPSNRKAVIISIGVVIVVVLYGGLYKLEEGQQAIVVQFGRPDGKPVTEAGLHMKLPFVQEVRRFEKRPTARRTIKIQNSMPF